MTFATVLTGWHGKKALGYMLTLDDTRMTVNMSAPDALERMKKLILDEASIQITPKHIMTDGYAEVANGKVPDEKDPARAAVLARMSLTRKALGLGIWMQNAYPQFVFPNNRLCSTMAFPSDDTLKKLRFSVSALVANPRSATYGGWGIIGLEPSAARIAPYTDGRKDMAYHFFSDASNGVKSVAGGVGMLAGGPIQIFSQTIHLAAPDSHSAEVTAAGTNMNGVLPVNGVLQEAHIRGGAPTPFYLDSKTTIYVANDDAAAKKSVWLKRRVDVLHDCVGLGEVTPLYLSEKDMAADPMTKYLPYAVWLRHMNYIINDSKSH